MGQANGRWAQVREVRPRSASAPARPQTFIRCSPEDSTRLLDNRSLCRLRRRFFQCDAGNAPYRAVCLAFTKRLQFWQTISPSTSLIEDITPATIVRFACSSSQLMRRRAAAAEVGSIFIQEEHPRFWRQLLNSRAPAQRRKRSGL